MNNHYGEYANNDSDAAGHVEDLETLQDASRNYGTRPGYELRDDVDLAGWDERSVWGYDTGTGSFYAQLWRNPGDSDAPDVWLSGVNPPLPWPGCIVAATVDATGCDPVSVVRALGLAHPTAHLRGRAELAAAAGPLAHTNEGYTAGKFAALQWAMGMATVTPGGRRPWPERQPPSVEEVVAEQYVITGRAYQPLAGDTRAWVGGADEAFAWLLDDR